VASIFDKALKGVYTPHRKNTKDSPTEVMPIPDVVYIVMSQHMGPPCTPLVKKGDAVKVGQVIGNSDAFLSAPIHSSVSGLVERIDEIIMPNGMRSKAVVIKTDKLQELHPDIKPPVVNSKEDFLAAIKASGMVGLGGAGFPTHIKFNPKNLDEIDTLIINAAECEPYITSDYRSMMEDRDRIIGGIRLIMKHLGIPACVIGIEDNKPEAIRSMTEALQDDPAITVKKLKSKYPQGAEKVLIYETTGRVVPEGKLPADVGAIVINVTTAASLERYLKDGIPLIKKRITVDGDAVKEKKNILAPIGTPIRDVLEFCGGAVGEVRKVLMGGPMMGITLYDIDYPVMKNNNAILFFAAGQVEEYDESPCIRCGRCARACPMNLMPLRLEDAFNKEDLEGLAKYKVNLCIECGCCAYACPAKRHLVQVNRLAKARLRAAAAKQ
jgi:electron transport complex protein RnfC